MTTEQKNQIVSLRKAGYGYAAVAQELGMPKSTVSSFCRKNGLTNIIEETEKNRLICPAIRGKLDPGKKAGNAGKSKVPAYKVTTIFADEPNEAAVAEALRILTNV